MIHRNWQKDLMLFSLKNHPLNNIFLTLAFVLSLMATTLISNIRAFCFKVRISTKLLWNTFQIQWNKSLHMPFYETHLSFGFCRKEDMLMSNVLVKSMSKKHVVFKMQNWYMSQFCLFLLYLWGSWFIHLLEVYLSECLYFRVKLYSTV